MNLEDIKNDRKNYDFYIPLTKIQFSVLREHLDQFVENCSCQHCQNNLDDILAELNYQYSEWFESQKE